MEPWRLTYHVIAKVSTECGWNAVFWRGHVSRVPFNGGTRETLTDSHLQKVWIERLA